MEKPMDHMLDGAFRELRALMNQDALTCSEYNKLRGLAFHASRKAPELYEAQWIPYMQAFPHHWNAHVYTSYDVDTASIFHEKMPFALFHLCLNMKSWSKARQKPMSWWARVGGISSTTQVLLELCALPHAQPALQALDLGYVGVDDAHVDRLISWLCAHPLSSIQLDGQHGGGVLCMALCESGVLEPLEHLHINDVPLGNEVAYTLSTLEWQRLHHLDLSATYIEDSGVCALAYAPHLSTLKTLILKKTGIGVTGARALTQSPSMKNLETLHIDAYWLKVDALYILGSSKALHPDVRGSDDMQRARKAALMNDS